MKNEAYSEVLKQITDDMYRHTAQARPVILFVAVIYWTVLRESANQFFLSLWVGAVFTVTALWTVLWWAKTRHREKYTENQWMAYYAVLAGFMGLAWSLVFHSVEDWKNLDTLAPAWMLMFGVISASSASMAPHLKSFALYTLPSVVTGLYMLLTRSGTELHWLSYALIAYYAILWLFTRSTHRLYINRLTLARENEALLRSLEDEATAREGIIETRTRELSERNEELANVADERLSLERQAQRQLELMNSVVDSTQDLIYWKDYTQSDGNYLGCNAAFASFLGLSEDEIVDRSDTELFGEVAGSLQRASDRDALNSGSQVSERWMDNPDGRRVLMNTLKTTFNDERGEIRGIVAVARDITNQKKAEETLRLQQRSLQHLAHHDTLTGLPNRLFLIDKLNHAVAEGDGESNPLAVLFLDLDHFKDINDSLGHSLGDQVLRAVARRLTSSVRQADVIARLGGDEFTILLQDLASPDAASEVARKILESLREPLQLSDRQLTVTASIGISIYPEDGHTTEELLRNADTAMYRAKRSGRNTFKHYSADMTERALARIAMETDLRGAAARGELSVEYQPQIDMNTGLMIGVEALLRWNHPERGPISPAHFIGLAEEAGLIWELGSWVFERVCEEQKRLAEEGMRGLCFAVNVSGYQMLDESFFELVENHVNNGKCDANSLEIEVTESVLLEDPERVAQVMRDLREIGVAVAVDDFGTGYSSLAYLKQYPINRLKIDASFVRDISSNPNDRAIARTIIALGRTLDMNVIAEGVETAEQRDLLLSDGCLQGQGFLYAPSLTPDDLLAFWLAQNTDP